LFSSWAGGILLSSRLLKNGICHAERSEASAVSYRKQTKSRSLAPLGMTWTEPFSQPVDKREWRRQAGFYTEARWRATSLKGGILPAARGIPTGEQADSPCTSTRKRPYFCCRSKRGIV